MPRRRSHGLTSNAIFHATAAAMTAALAAAGCQAGPTDNGCQITRQVVIPGTTALALLTDVRLDRVGGATVVLGTDDTTVRRVTIADDGTVGDEQSVALPAGTIRSWNALAGVDAPGDHVIVGALVPAENGTDAELRLLSAPVDGSPAGDPGAPVATFGGGVDAPPAIAMGTSASAMYAGVAWIDSARGTMYAFVDGQAALAGDPAATEATPAPGYSCL